MPQSSHIFWLAIGIGVICLFGPSWMSLPFNTISTWLPASLPFTTTPTESYGEIAAIDIGTSYSSVGVVRLDGTVWTSGKIPSIVSFTRSGGVLVGERGDNPSNVFTLLNLVIGRRQSNIPVTASELPYKITYVNGKVVVKVVGGAGEEYQPEELIALLMLKLKQLAEQELGRSISSVVLPVPANFTRLQQQALTNAVVIAGLKVARFIPSTTAVALSYMDRVAERGTQRSTTTAIINMGGGYTDVAIFKLDQSESFVELVYEQGITFGGEDITRGIYNGFLKTERLKGKAIDDLTLMKLRQEAERVKRSLASTKEEEVSVYKNGQRVFFYPMTQAMLMQYSEDLRKRVVKLFGQVIRMGEMNQWSVDEVVLNGGSVKLPELRRVIARSLDLHMDKNVKVSEADSVVHGAALYACLLMHRNCSGNYGIIENIRYGLGIRLEEDGKISPIVKVGFPLPFTKKVKLLAQQLPNFPHPAVILVEYALDVKSSTNALKSQSIGRLSLSGISKGYDVIEIDVTVSADHSIEVSAVNKEFVEGKERKTIRTIVSNWDELVIHRLAKRIISLMNVHNEGLDLKKQCDDAEQMLYKVYGLINGDIGTHFKKDGSMHRLADVAAELSNSRGPSADRCKNLYISLQNSARKLENKAETKDVHV